MNSFQKLPNYVNNNLVRIYQNCIMLVSKLLSDKLSEEAEDENDSTNSDD